MGGQSAPRALVVADVPAAHEDRVAEPQEVWISRKELLEASGISNEVLRELESFGLVVQAPGTSYYDATALRIATLTADLAAFGYGPRHLRPIKLAADRELALVEQVVLPMARSRQPDARAKAEETARSIAALAAQLHSTLVNAGLPRALGS